MIKCNKCEQYKELIEFNKNNSSKTGYQTQCKECKKNHYAQNKEKYITKSKEKYQQNKQDILEYYKEKYQQNSKEYKQKSKQYRENNIDKVKEYKKQKYNIDKDKIKQYVKQWYTENKEHCKLKSKQWDKNNKDRKNKRQRERYKNDTNFKLLLNLRGRFNQALKTNTKRSSILTLLGCSIEEYKLYIESQFKPEMTWENHGEIWEIDHIIPCDSYDLTNTEQQKQCFHYTNTQPLFKTTSIAESFGYGEIGNRDKSNTL